MKPRTLCAGILLLITFFLIWNPDSARAAIGCTLNNPAQDLKYLFPEVTSFREEVRDFPRLSDGKNLYAALKERLGTDLDPVYEAFDTPYTIYTVFKGADVIGIVHGVNVPGRGGVIQVFLSVDPGTGEIRTFFFQRLESKAARLLKDRKFRDGFAGLSLADFYKHDYFLAAEPGSDADRLGKLVPAVKDPDQDSDVKASVRGVRKNLILLDFFLYQRRHEPFFERTKKLLAEKGK